MSTFVIVQTGNPPASIRDQHGSFAEMFLARFPDAAPVVEVCRVYAGESLPAVVGVIGALVTGSPANVTDQEPWMDELAQWLRELHAAGKPLLGVCFGHQIMAWALGGEVDYHPQGREVGTHKIELTPEGRMDPWLADLPAQFSAQLVHEQTVLVPPPGATVLARNDHDACQILRYGPKSVSVQFHPEFSPDIMRSYVVAMADKLKSEGMNPEQLLAEVSDSEAASQLVARFIQRYAASACSTTS